MLLGILFCRNPFPFAVDADDRQRPEGNQIDSGQEFGYKGWEKFPVPAEQANQQSSDHNVKQVIGG